VNRQRAGIGRAAWAALAAVLVATLGHALGGGGLPTVASAPVVLIVSALTAIGITRIRWTVPRVGGALLGTQAVVHATLWITTAPTSAHPRLAAYLPEQAASAHAQGHTHAAALSPRMLAAHLIAAAVTAAALVAADSLVALVRAFAARVSLLRVLPDLVPATPRVVAPRRVAVVPQLVHLVTMRGNAPPAYAGLG
jgi:hypothetical protein